MAIRISELFARVSEDYGRLESGRRCETLEVGARKQGSDFTFICGFFII